MTLRLRTLGGLALLDDGGPVRGAAGRGRNLALMALLGRAGETGMTRDKLAAYLWPESDQGRARHSLDQAFYTLRQTIGAETFVTVGDGVGLDGDRVHVDASAFVRAVDAEDFHRAVALYDGPFLDGFHVSASAEFERWADEHRATLERQYVQALESLARAAGEVGDNRAALDHWCRLVAVSPLSSRVVLELMRALERAGDRARALDAARTHAALVQEELGTRPDSSVEAYAAELELSADSPTPLPERGPGDGATPQARDTTSVSTSVERPTGETGGDPGLESPQARPGPRGRSPVRTAWVAAAAAVVLSVSAGLVVSRRPPAQTTPARVGVPVFQNHTNDPAFDAFGQMAADWVVESLARTGLVELVGPGGDMTAVASVVEGRIYRNGDSVWIQASVRSSSDGLVVRALEPVGADADAPVRALEPLRQQVLGAMGTLYDPRMRAWAESALRPPSFEAYREFAAGIDRYRARDLPGMAARFRRSVEIDPDYLAARLWLAWTSLMRDDLATADSLVTALNPQRERMSPLERAWHDRQLAIVRGDNQASYAAAQRMARLAPRSGWVVALADAALAVNRPDEAIAALEKAGLDALGPVRDHGSSLLTFAYHMVGDYARELAVTEEAIRALGLDWDFVGPGVRALAAGGRANALQQRLDQLRNQPPGPYGAFRGPTSLRAAVVELRAHGHEDAAVALVNRTLPAEKGEPGGNPGTLATAGPDRYDALWHRVLLFYEVARWDEASRILDALPAEPDSHEHRAMAALLAARRGDAGAARRLDAELAALEEPYLLGAHTVWRARIAAVLGDGDRAVRLLRQAFSEGQDSRLRWALHTDRDFDELRENPAFRAMYTPGSGR